MNNFHEISPEAQNFDSLAKIFERKKKLRLSGEAIERVSKCRSFLEKKLINKNAHFYGINTGFGSLCNVLISETQIEELQANLVKSHACGMGEEVPEEIARMILYLKIRNLAYGYSGVRLKLIERLITFFNEGITPVILQQGSLGASGDLAPLAHLSLPLLGSGEVYYKGEKHYSARILSHLNLEPLTLQSKEGLALLNGTQFSLAYGIHGLLKSKRLCSLANLCAALSMDIFNCHTEPAHALIQRIRPHEGQKRAASNVLEYLKGSNINERKKDDVQDPYSFRCVPQVHGASIDALSFIEKTFLTELNAVTDNPSIFAKEDKILSGGNFHAQPLALSLDFLALAIAELGSISERRTYQLISGHRGLPEYLVKGAGLNSGLMIPQYTAASIVSQNKQYCTPASSDSIVSSMGQEDHVSMAANAGTKSFKVIENVERVLAIEFMTAMQAREFRKNYRQSEYFNELAKAYRKKVPYLDKDRILNIDILNTIDFLRGIDILV